MSLLFETKIHMRVKIILWYCLRFRILISLYSLLLFIMSKFMVDTCTNILSLLSDGIQFSLHHVKVCVEYWPIFLILPQNPRLYLCVLPNFMSQVSLLPTIWNFNWNWLVYFFINQACVKLNFLKNSPSRSKLKNKNITQLSWYSRFPINDSV